MFILFRSLFFPSFLIFLFLLTTNSVIVMGDTCKLENINVNQRYTPIISGVTVTNKCKCPVSHILAECPGWEQIMVPEKYIVKVIGDGLCIISPQNTLRPHRQYFFMVGLVKRHHNLKPISIGAEFC